MGKSWDYGVPGTEVWREVLRVLKPGGMLLAFGGTRTHHRLMCGLEDAGFEIRDCLMWLYGSGFPKSLDISKAIDKVAGIWRGRAGAVTTERQPAKGTEYERTDKGDPATPAAYTWTGYGTAFKPAWEPIILAMKPLDGTFANNARTWGVAGLNIDDCRIGMSTTDAKRSGRPGHSHKPTASSGVTGWGANRMHAEQSSSGRWPANLLLAHVEYVWYALRYDTPQETAEAIHSYYGIEQTVPTMRLEDLGDEVPAPHKKVLQQQVCWCQYAEDTQGRVGYVALSGMPDRVRGDTRMGAKREKEVLQSEMQRELLRQKATASALERQVKAQGKQERKGTTRSREVVSVEGGKVHRRRRVSICDGGDALGSRTEAGKKDDQAGVHSGAPSRGGGTAGASAHSERDSPPPRRGQSKQPARQSRSDAAESSLTEPSASGEEAASAGSREPKTAIRYPRVEVEASQIPEGWRRYFVDVAVSGCREVGTKRIKPIGATARNKGATGSGASFVSGKPHSGYRDADGREEVAAWSCVENCPVRLLDEQAGKSTSRAAPIDRPEPNYKNKVYGRGMGGTVSRANQHSDSGGPSRFFYTAKVSKRERNIGLPEGVLCKHPTLKPIKLTEYLARLLLPPARDPSAEPRRLLVPFAGAGSEMIGALLARWDEVIGIEKDPEAVAWARMRIAGATDAKD